MKPAPFQYVAATTVGEAIAHLAEHGDEAKIIAGGQSLLPMMALRLARPSVLVDVGAVVELSEIRLDETLEIGAGVTQDELGRNTDVRSACPVMADVVPLIAHTAIRNRGTIGGSLAHADPAAELPAVALLCDADVVLRGPSGERVVPATDFFVSYLTTALRPDEVLSAVRIPRHSPRTGTAFRELSRRHGDFALVGAGARVTLDDAGEVTAARVAFIGVAATPVVVELPVEDVEGGVRAAAAALEPAGDVHASAAYRRHVAVVLATDVLERAAVAAGREP